MANVKDKLVTVEGLKYVMDNYSANTSPTPVSFVRLTSTDWSDIWNTLSQINVGEAALFTVGNSTITNAIGPGSNGISSLVFGIVARLANLKFDFMAAQPNGSIYIWRRTFSSDHTSATIEGTAKVISGSNVT